MLTKALIIGVVVGTLAAVFFVVWIKTRTLAALLWLAGTACLGIVVLTHIAEAEHWLPRMRWGQPDSAGHYIDLTSAILGVVLLISGTVSRMIHRE